MDPALDPPPLSAQPTGVFPAAAAADAPLAPPVAANPFPAHSVPSNHPPYAEMITAAIGALNERDGSSSRAIGKYIETHYQGLPPTHATLLTNNLKRLKANGQLVMVKKSYALPTRSAVPAVNGDVNAVPADSAPSGSKRRPGRPPKPKPDAGQAAVPVFAAPANVNTEPAAAPVVYGAHIAVGPTVTPVRGGGRPPKRGPGRPVQSGGSGKPRGRPRKSTAVAPPAVAVAAKGSGRPRGRPPKAVNVVEGAVVGGGVPAVPVPVVGGVASVGAKRRGRPPKAGGVAKQPRKLRKLSGKPLGRPRKNDGAVALTSGTPDSQLLPTYLKLYTDLDALKKKVKETADVIRPSLNNDVAINALNVLEAVAVGTVAPADGPVPPQQPQPQSYFAEKVQHLNADC